MNVQRFQKSCKKCQNVPRPSDYRCIIILTRNPSPSATTCKASGGMLASLAHPSSPLAPFASTPHAHPHPLGGRIQDCSLQQPQTKDASDGLGGQIQDCGFKEPQTASEVGASNDLGGRTEVAVSNGLKWGR